MPFSIDVMWSARAMTEMRADVSMPVAVAKQFGGVALDLLQSEDVGDAGFAQQAVAHDAIDPCRAVKNRTASGPR